MPWFSGRWIHAALTEAVALMERLPSSSYIQALAATELCVLFCVDLALPRDLD